MNLSPIIDTGELLRLYQQPDVLMFDVSNAKNARADYEAEHLEGAFFIDLNTQLADIKADLSDGGRHPLPAVEVFARTLAELGISTDTHVVIYDHQNGANAAARFWWMLRAVGHEKVQVLNGGFQRAKALGFPMGSGSETPNGLTEPYPVDQWQLPTIDMNEVEQVAQSPDHIVVDVRDAARYAGLTEPIDLIAGHIPGAINIPFTENLDENGLFLSPEALLNKYEAKFGATPADNIAVHCGSGVTACHTLLALAHAGLDIPKLYVGSWSEWSRNGKEMVLAG